MMNIKATNFSATICGIWTSFWLLSFTVWSTNHRFEGHGFQIAFAVLLFLFFIVPSYFFVMGPSVGNQGSGHSEDEGQVSRRRMRIRMACWALGALITGILYAAILA